MLVGDIPEKDAMLMLVRGRLVLQERESKGSKKGRVPSRRRKQSKQQHLQKTEALQSLCRRYRPTQGGRPLMWTASAYGVGPLCHAGGRGRGEEGEGKGRSEREEGEGEETGEEEKRRAPAAATASSVQSYRTEKFDPLNHDPKKVDFYTFLFGWLVGRNNDNNNGKLPKLVDSWLCKNNSKT